MSEQNPYKTPEAELTNTDAAAGSSKVHEFDRFSAWAVFGLSVITLGIYMYFWFYNRTTKMNELHDNKIPMGLVIGFIVTGVLMQVLGYIPNDTIIMLSGILVIPYLVTYFMALYKLRARLLDVLNEGRPTEEHIHVGGIMTFFFNVIYLQYKINQGIDELPSS